MTRLLGGQRESFDGGGTDSFIALASTGLSSLGLGRGCRDVDSGRFSRKRMETTAGQNATAKNQCEAYFSERSRSALFEYRVVPLVNF